jgi:hypothetical protein
MPAAEQAADKSQEEADAKAQRQGADCCHLILLETRTCCWSCRNDAGGVTSEFQLYCR